MQLGRMTMSTSNIAAVVCILSIQVALINPAFGAALDSWKVVVPNGGVSAMHMTTAHTDKVIFFDRTNFGKSQIGLPNGTCRDNPLEKVLKHDCTAHSVEYDSLTNAIRPLFIFSDTFCSSGTWLPNGTLQQTGGDNEGDHVTRTIGPGPNDNWVEKPGGLYTRRWYSTDQILPDGRVIIIGGTYQPTYEFLPRSGYWATSLPFLQKAFDPISQNNIYPFVHLTPDGNLFIFANVYSILFDYKSNKVVKTFPDFGTDPRVYPYSGTSMMLPLTAADNFTNVEIFICGGGPNGSYAQAYQRNYWPALNTCGRMVITSATPKWAVETMPSPRIMSDGLLLPTGECLIINGAQAGVSGWSTNSNPAFAPFLYDPVTHKFTVQSATTIARMYHSSANVQSDGTILVGGGNDQSGYVFTGVRFPTELRLEKYSPYYLNPSYDKKRFTILDVPITVQISSVFLVKFSCPVRGGPKAVQISLYFPSFTTHANSMSQRMVILAVGPITQPKRGVWQVPVTAPPSATITPPGYYMLTALNKGTSPAIPSTAKWVQIF